MTRKSTISPVIMFMLPWFGVWPGRSIILINRLFWIVTLAFTGFCHYLYVSTHLSSENFFNLVDCLCSFLAQVKVLIKLVMFWINQQKLMEILAVIVNDWKDCANSDVSLRVMIRKAKLSDRITNTILILHVATIIAYSMGVVLEDADATDQTIELPYVNTLQLPFNVSTQRTYRLVLLTEIVHLIFLNTVAGFANAMLLTLILHVGGQMEILESRISQFIFKEIENKKESITGTIKIIQKHQKIIQFSENIEIIYTHIALCVFASNMAMICSIGFLIVIAIDTSNVMELVRCLLFLVITNLEAYIFCYAGEYLSNKSKAIGFAMYNCPWYNLKPKHSRILLFVILRSQKQLILTAGKMMELSLVSFASIMNASGSYLSVLLAMQ
ncbi:Odorant receptor 105 [Nylanderia fulva]|uniref:Odorant receptor n=1 Tax=Nylanderia fulva TaxID=613905 RepID=A0A6G1LRH1_9HYME|nr:odorant receptor 4-like isoform X2 [Nylanderia fulva]KAF3054633.1 Odorant receptor 105 [Nylanderia fulva]